MVHDLYKAISTHFVKYSVATKMQLCMLKVYDSIVPMTSMPQAMNVKDELIALSREVELKSHHHAPVISQSFAQTSNNRARSSRNNRLAGSSLLK